MTPQELKNSILQLAIQGKLVEQRAEEGTVEELFVKIQEEKQRLIAEKKIKKEKPLPEITEEEKPFDIPESWKWVRLRNIVFNRGQLTPQCTFSYIDIGSIDNQRQLLSADENIIEADKAPSRARKIVEQGDILYSTVRPYLHNMCIVDRQFSHKPIASTGFAVLTCHQDIFNKYLFYYLMSPAFDSYANSNENSKGVAYPAINDERLYRAMIALPPLAEQKRIVAKIEELLPYIDRYEQAWSKLEKFNSRFPEDMKKSLLQYAIQGNLVEQRAEEGTGEELFVKIQEEKQRLIAEKKIKKEKPLPEITEEEKPFDIPESWKWVRLRNIVFNRGQLTPQCTFSYIDIGSIDNQRQLLSADENIIEADKAPSRARKIVEQGDILYSTVRPYLHNMCIVDRQFSHKPIASTGFAVLTCHQDIFNKYLFYYLMSPAFDSYANSNENSKGVAYPAINDEKLYRAMIALPPLAEQKRIVEKLEQLLPLCERLK